MLWQRRQRADDVEMTSELGDKTSGSSPKKKSVKDTARESTLVGGVSVSPLPLTAGETLTVKYNGLLASSGADQMYLHAGYGHGQWHQVHDVPMQKDKPGVWRATLPLQRDETSRLNFCFKDRAENWDNNYGLNWSLEIHNGEVAKF